MIVVEDVHMHFGGFGAVNGASLEIADGSITGLIGPNGAGKTTLFNVIAGALKPTSGRVTMAGEDITGPAPSCAFCQRTPANLSIAHEFHSMTVRENLMRFQAGNREKGFEHLVPARNRSRGGARACREGRTKSLSS